MPRFDEVTTDFLIARQAGLSQSRDRLRRGRGVLPYDIWHIAGFPIATVGVAGLALNTLFAQPFFTALPLPLRAIGQRVTGAGAAGSVTRIGIYAADEVTAYPTALLVDSGSIDTTIASFKNIPINLQLSMGTLYFFVTLIGVAAPTIWSASTWEPAFGWAVDFTSSQNGWSVPLAFGALPNTFPSGPSSVNASTASFPLVGVLAS